MATQVLVPIDASEVTIEVRQGVQRLADLVGPCWIEVLHIFDPAWLAQPHGAAGAISARRLDDLERAWAHARRQAHQLAQPPAVQAEASLVVGPLMPALAERIATGAFDYIVIALAAAPSPLPAGARTAQGARIIQATTWPHTSWPGFREMSVDDAKSPCAA